MSKKKERVPEDPLEENIGEADGLPSETEKGKDTESVLEDTLAAEKEKYLRLAAEYDNFRKRSMKERENIYTDIRIDTVCRFLPVYDNLERAILQETSDEAYRKGIEMTLNQMLEVMGKLGVTVIDAMNKPFDPALHNAVMHIEDESYGAGIIVEEFQKGFKLGDRVMRFSMVKVAN